VMTRPKGRWLTQHLSRIAMDVLIDMDRDKAARVVRSPRHGASGE
jgi:hypothetical protein